MSMCAAAVAMSSQKMVKHFLQYNKMVLIMRVILNSGVFRLSLKSIYVPIEFVILKVHRIVFSSLQIFSLKAK